MELNLSPAFVRNQLVSLSRKERQGKELTWLAAGRTLAVLSNSSRNGWEKLETPIALALPVARRASICFQVSAMLQERSRSREPSGRVGNLGSFPFGLRGTGQCTKSEKKSRH